MKRLIIALLLATLILIPCEALAKKPPKPDKPDKVTIVVEDEGLGGSQGDLNTWLYAREAYEWVTTEGRQLPYILVWFFNKINEIQAKQGEFELRIEALENRCNP